MIESSIVTLNGKIIDYAKGTPASVEFDFERVWRHIKKCPTGAIHFIHVHPQGLTKLSLKDVECILGFNMALGNYGTYWFSIITFDNSDLFNIKHTCTIYQCNNQKDFYEVSENPQISNDQLLFLKHLSYGKEIENANI